MGLEITLKVAYIIDCSWVFNFRGGIIAIYRAPQKSDLETNN